ncbi:hypothetical protein SUGI_0123350 [Cryptomeria japonica]|nr:hypothetical protein SUGI_0123350 [Cryptomeria japonica]
MTEPTNNKELFILASNSALDFWPVGEGRTFPIIIDISYINLQFQVEFEWPCQSKRVPCVVPFLGSKLVETVTSRPFAKTAIPTAR